MHRARAALVEGMKEQRGEDGAFAVRLLIGLCLLHWMTADLTALQLSATQLLRLAAERDLQESVGWAPAPIPTVDLVEPLTFREVEILELLAQRLSAKEIAERLIISPRTVKRHTANIYQKLGAHGRQQAIVEARSLGLLPPR